MRARTTASGDAGFTLIDVLFVLALIGLLSTLSVPTMMRARSAANSSSALSTLRVINSAQLTFALTCGSGFYAPDLPTLGIAPPGSPEPFLTVDLSAAATVVRSNYSFRMMGTAMAGSPATCNGLPANSTAPSYALIADSLDPYNLRFFGSNADGILYQHNASFAGSMPEAGIPAVGSPVQW